MARIDLKPLDQQVVVITGATSGIGLATARKLARAGAKLVLSARNADALKEIVASLGRNAQVETVVCDVAKADEVEALGTAAIARFGRIDTWVNNAGLAVYGKTTEISLEDQKQLFEVNFWGVVNGSRVAVRHLKGSGGALINVGSVLSEGAIPLQGTYSASKHAVKAWTDALRIELMEENAPISVTLIKPAAMNTPYVEHAKNYMAEEPVLPPPVYDPNLVARAIAHAAEHPIRDITVGGAGALTIILGKFLPSVADMVMSRTMFEAQKRNQPKDANRAPSLYGPQRDGRVHGPYPGPVRSSSGWLTFRTLPKGAILTLVAAGAALTIAAKLAGDGRLGLIDNRSAPRRWADRLVDDRSAPRRWAEDLVGRRSRPKRWLDWLVDEAPEQAAERLPDRSTYRSLARRAERLYDALHADAKKAARKSGLRDLFG